MDLLRMTSNNRQGDKETNVNKNKKTKKNVFNYNKKA